MVSLEYSVHVTRSIHVTTTLQTSKGPEEITWTQNLAFSNYGIFANNGSDQDVQQNTSGLNTSPASTYARRFKYPLWVASTYDAPLAGGLKINATMRRGKTVEQIGELAFHNA